MTEQTDAAEPRYTLKEVQRVMGHNVEGDAGSWPARAYAYGTWGYALERAREHAQQRHQRVYLYRGALDGEPVWVAAWDPKPTRVLPPGESTPARVPSDPPCHCWYDGPPCPRHNEDGSARVPTEEG